MSVLVQKYNFDCHLCGAKSGSLTLREECLLRVFKNRVLRKLLGPKWRDEAGVWCFT